MARRTTSTRTTFFYDWSEVPVVVDVPMVCILLQLSEARVKQLCARGELKATKAGKMWRINKRDLMEYVGAA